MRYRVSFFRTLPCADGSVFKSIEMAMALNASSTEQALKSAQKQFEHLYEIPDWKDRASNVEVTTED